MNNLQRKEIFETLSSAVVLIPRLEQTIEAVDQQRFDLHWEKLSAYDSILLQSVINLSGKLNKIITEIMEND